MNKTLKIALIVAAGLVVTGGLLVAGFLAGRVFTGRLGVFPASRMYARLDNYPAQPDGWRQDAPAYGPFDKMSQDGWRQDAPVYGPFDKMSQDGWRQDAPAYGPFDKMGRDGRTGRRGSGFTMLDRSNFGCGGYLSNGTAAATAEPLSLEAAEAAVQKYLDTLNNDDLILSEVMIFDNQAYASVVEKSTGMGAVELLVDHATQAVYPQRGATRMWNQKYSLLSGRGMRGVGNANLVNPTVESAEDMTVSAEKAGQIAQDYLDQSQDGEQAGEAEPFYGYYTLDILKDGKVTGMLSVNGFSGQIFEHDWYGTLLEVSEE